LHCFREDRGQIRFDFLRVSNFYIRSTCKFNPPRFNHERGEAGRHVSATLDARARKRTPPVGGRFFGRGPTIIGVETPQNFNTNRWGA